MTPRLTAGLAPVLTCLLACLPACETRVVELVVPDPLRPDGGTFADAGSEPVAPLKCEMVARADGTVCGICYSAEGKIVTSSCPAPEVDAGSDPGVPAAPAEMCKDIPAADTRCLICYSAAGMTMPCLKCDAPVKTSDKGDFCRACGWSDRAGRCLQCFTADGTVTHDDCDLIRTPAAMTASGMTPDADVMTPGSMP